MEVINEDEKINLFYSSFVFRSIQLNTVSAMDIGQRISDWEFLAVPTLNNALTLGHYYYALKEPFSFLHSYVTGYKHIIDLPDASDPFKISLFL